MQINARKDFIAKVEQKLKVLLTKLQVISAQLVLSVQLAQVHTQNAQLELTTIFQGKIIRILIV